MAIATYDDANLLLRLYDLRREDKMRAARDWFVKNARFASMEEMQKVCPPGSQENAYYRQVVSYWDMTASFVTSGVLNAELFFQSNRELVLVWVRVEKLIPQVREAFNDPSAFRNLERVAKLYIEWMNAQGPDVYSAFVSRIK
ncbi:MAG: hypothetical protein NTZ56_23680 [Acidobacteria bacterium]|nr:hypothetical protein [Acidobacteriota bacterium]